MTRLLVALTCLFLPVPGFGQLLSSAGSSAQCADSSPAAEPASVLSILFPSPILPVCESAQSGVPAAKAAQDGKSATPLQPKPNGGRPHLVELSSANWRPLRRSQKFALFYRDLYNWGTHLSLAIDAGLSFATNDRSYLGPGAAGYFSRYGLNVADEANFTFFGAFFFPSIFHEDPRYIPLDHGTVRTRLAYALSRVVVTRNDAGGSEVNKSKILGTVVSTSISSAYYASFGGAPGVGSNFASMGINMASDAAFDVFKEFWPDIARKLKLNVWVRNLVRSSIRDVIRVQ